MCWHNIHKTIIEAAQEHKKNTQKQTTKEET
jgi:hypothetical protein